MDGHCGGFSDVADSRIVIPAFTEADRAALRARVTAELPQPWRTRFAPAPTGLLHIGHAVNAVFVWSIARAFGGSVVLRIEDHDWRRARSTFASAIEEELAWLGLAADNASLGLPTPLRQHDRDDAYQAAIAQLGDLGLVYACRCSRRDIASMGTLDEREEVQYPGTCNNNMVSLLETPARRVRLDSTTVVFDDLRHGPLQQVPQTQCGDLLVRDRHGQWTYQFAVVVDDLAQRIDLIIRGDDLLASTGRQLLLAQLLGRESSPMLLHHALIRRPDGAKLSKSQGDTGLADLRDAGWSAERVLGHAAWLGGLQTTPAELNASALGSLWVR